MPCFRSIIPQQPKSYFKRKKRFPSADPKSQPTAFTSNTLELKTHRPHWRPRSPSPDQSPSTKHRKPSIPKGLDSKAKNFTQKLKLLRQPQTSEHPTLTTPKPPKYTLNPNRNSLDATTPTRPCPRADMVSGRSSTRVNALKTSLMRRLACSEAGYMAALTHLERGSFTGAYQGPCRR